MRREQSANDSNLGEGTLILIWITRPLYYYISLECRYDIRSSPCFTWLICTPDIIKLKIILMTPSVHASLPNSYSNTIFPKKICSIASVCPNLHTTVTTISRAPVNIAISDNLCPYEINRLGSYPVVLHLRMKFPPRTNSIKSLKVPKEQAIVYFPCKIIRTSQLVHVNAKVIIRTGLNWEI